MLEDIVNFVKHALENQPVRDQVRDLLQKAVAAPIEELFGLLVKMRETIFPLDLDPTISPEEINPEFIDFLGDDGMWDYIYFSVENNKYDDLEAIQMLRNSVKDLLDRNVIFSDLSVEE